MHRQEATPKTNPDFSWWAAPPGITVLAEQLFLPALQFSPPGVTQGHAGARTLDADELTTIIARLLQPVGEDQAWPVVPRRCENRLQKGFFMDHSRRAP